MLKYLCLKKLCLQNIKEIKNKNIIQNYSWVNRISYRGPVFDVLECNESKTSGKGETENTRFVWATNFLVSNNNYIKIAKGGRLRWKIENEGFNIQKNRGFNLEHPYSQDETSMKNLYLILQIAYIISQLMEKGNLLKHKIQKVFGSVTMLFEQLLEDLRTKSIGVNFSNKPIQIRLASFP